MEIFVVLNEKDILFWILQYYCMGPDRPQYTDLCDLYLACVKGGCCAASYFRHKHSKNATLLANTMRMLLSHLCSMSCAPPQSAVMFNFSFFLYAKHNQYICTCCHCHWKMASKNLSPFSYSFSSLLHITSVSLSIKCDLKSSQVGFCLYFVISIYG